MLKLGTLMKYEFKSVGRILLPMFGAFLILSVIFGGVIRGGEIVYDNDTAWNFARAIELTLFAAYCLLGLASFVVAVVVLIQRFYKNLLGNEGYLCFALPVKTNTHITNKILSASIWVTIGALVCAVSWTIIMYIGYSDGIYGEDIWQVIEEITDYNSGWQRAVLLMEILALIFIMAGEAAVKIYAAISVGQIFENHRITGAIGAYIGFGICEAVATNIFMVPLDNGSISGLADKLFNMSSFAQLQMYFLFLTVLSGILIAIYWVVTNRMLSRHLNLQ